MIAAFGYARPVRRIVLCLALAACSSSTTTPATTTDAATAPPAVGDVETFAELEGGSEGLAFGDGVLYVGSAGAIHRVSADGKVERWVEVPGVLGIAVRPDGDLVVCGKGEGALAKSGVLWHVAKDGTKRVLVGPSGDVAFEQTNFVAIAKDGTLVWSDSAANKVWRAAADGSGVALVTDAITYPNGLAFSPDGATLWVASWDGKKVHALAREGDGFGAPTVAFDGVENVDGIAVAADGDLYLVASGLGIVRATPGGGTTVVAAGDKFKLPANGAFGRDAFGDEWLYVTNLIGLEVSRVFVGEKGAALR